MAQTAGSSLRQRAGTYWQGSGTWRDSHVLCRTTELPVSWRSMPPISIHPLFSYQDYWARTWARPPLRSARSSADFLQPSSWLFTWLKAPWSDGFYLTRRLRERNLGRVPPQRTSAAANQAQYRSCGGTRVCGRSGFGCPFPSRENKWLHFSPHPSVSPPVAVR